ncbi:MAG TPA: glycosyltransferase family 2 protein [Gemmataceae bacterium]|nr:glycosyltransferase family 2 protein [Gemmataceae bacterium]
MSQALIGRGAVSDSIDPARCQLFISVIVPVRNEEKFLGPLLDRLLGQRYDPACFEVIVVDGESNDGTVQVVENRRVYYANLHLLRNSRVLASAGRNIGVRAARGDVVVIVDGHCEIETCDYLSELAETFIRSGADCIGRPQPLDVSKATNLQRAIALARPSWLGHQPASFIYANRECFAPPESIAVAYQRTVFDAVGLFDEEFDACEDVEFNHRVDRAGLRCYFAPRLAVRYAPRNSLSGLFRQMARYGRGRVRLLRKDPTTFSAPCFLPAVFLLVLILGAITAWMTPWLSWAYSALLGIYVLTTAAVSCGLALRARDVRVLAWLPFVFAAIHLGAGWGVLQEGLRGKKIVLASSSRPQPADRL